MTLKSRGVFDEDFKSKAGVITGAASGIGFGLVKHGAKEVMKVALADIEEDALAHQFNPQVRESRGV
jgi:NAD(P)-dependent dehydrogenase (short-subunit alcohol dehydrogenase family)